MLSLFRNLLSGQLLEQLDDRRRARRRFRVVLIVAGPLQRENHRYPRRGAVRFAGVEVTNCARYFRRHRDAANGLGAWLCAIGSRRRDKIFAARKRTVRMDRARLIFEKRTRYPLLEIRGPQGTDVLSRNVIGRPKGREQARRFQLFHRFLEASDDFPSPRRRQLVDKPSDRFHLDLRNRHELATTRPATLPA